MKPKLRQALRGIRLNPPNHEVCRLALAGRTNESSVRGDTTGHKAADGPTTFASPLSQVTNLASTSSNYTTYVFGVSLFLEFF